ncbi:unnamed protein product [Sphagnum jensenii]|uniref:Uncharacterized protein n=1 Tax=Sphagnum jensenii TaxID=128206 RepID=A0ABP1BD71_9BRYO
MIAVMAKVQAEGADRGWLKSYLKEGANHQKIPQPDEAWYCPICCEKKATDLANHAEKAVTAARAKLEAFRKLSSYKHHHYEKGLSDQYETGRGSKHSKITGHHSAAVKNNNEIEGRALVTMRHSQDLLNILKARKDLLRQNLASAELALFASKPSKLDKWRTSYNIADSSSEETSNQNSRQEDEVEVGFREISAAAMDIRRNLDFLEYGFNPVFQAFEEVCDVGKGGSMYDKSTASNVIQRANSGKEEGVQKFSHDDHLAYPWKEILEFGVGRFQPGRTAVDLKDKLRNLRKGIS